MKATKGARHVWSFSTLLPVLVFALLVSGCSQHSKKAHPNFNSKFILYSHGRILVDKAVIDEIKKIYRNIHQQTTKKAELVVAQEFSPIAFATLVKGKYKITISIGMVDLLEDRWDEYAFVLAHELSHVALDHVRERSKYRKKTNTGSEILGFALGLLGMPLGFVATDAGSYLVDLKYDRDQERLADEQALRYMLSAGYNLDGATRFHQRLSEFSIERTTNLLSTHPTSDERVQNTREFIKHIKQKSEL